MAATLLKEYEWDLPAVYLRASKPVAPRQLRKTSKNLVEVMRSQKGLNAKNAKEWFENVAGVPEAPIEGGWSDVDNWFFPVEGVRDFSALWGPAEDLPPNLAVSLAMHGRLELPECPSFGQEEHWRFDPLNVAPPSWLAQVGASVEQRVEDGVSRVKPVRRQFCHHHWGSVPQ